MEKNKFFWINLTVALLLIGAAAYSVFLLWPVNRELGQTAAEWQEKNRPSRLEATLITDGGENGLFDFGPLIDGIKKQKVELSEKRLNEKEVEARDLLKLYNLDKIPALLIKGELERDPILAALWLAWGTVENGVFVFRQQAAPYKELETGEVRGLFILTMLVDPSCAECYDVQNNEAALKNLGVLKFESKAVDVGSAEGKELVKKYDIRYAPAIVLSGDLAVYPNLNSVWPSVGTIEKDGAYVFRENGLKLMGNYKDLKTGKMIKP